MKKQTFPSYAERSVFLSEAIVEQCQRAPEERRADELTDAEKRLNAIGEDCGTEYGGSRIAFCMPHPPKQRGAQRTEIAEQCKYSLMEQNVQIFVMCRVDDL